ncbi:hypothetical protein [Bradyrhizobium sp. 76]|uniref:hypothetical protein n=1 Tax=Bradyrhizobium sp. 76 TaxID=2782680 RepID=UPI001FF76C09|nr:hypothetical protein [Bradyrhizobium sp. 76]MCK1407624.1 hypothetical protein [Bradyrhizobium sp. 76]
MVELTAAFDEGAGLSMQASLSTRENHGVPYLMGAARFSRRVGEVEIANSGQPFGNFWEEMRDCATACVLMSDAAIESYANELFSDAEKIFPPEFVAGLDLLKADVEKKNVFEKLDLVLVLRGRDKLDRGSSSFQAVKMLGLLRNELTHFKPEWSHKKQRHLVVSEKLRGLFTLNPWFGREGAFPSAWVSHSCTIWAVTSAIKFLQEFEDLADLPGRTPWPAFQDRLIP